MRQMEEEFIERKHDMNRQDNLNKRIMKDTLRRIRKTGLHPINIRYPDGYFIIQNENKYSMMHFDLIELPDFQFAIWYTRMSIGRSWSWTPTIFAERKWLIDKFKPSRAEWSPLFNTYVQNDKLVPWDAVWDIINQLPKLIREPWNMVGETKDEYEEIIKIREQKFTYIDEVKIKIAERMQSIMKENNIPLVIVDHKPIWWETIYYFITDSDEAFDVDMNSIIDELCNDYDYISSYDFDIKCGLYRTTTETLNRALTCKHETIPHILPIGLRTLNFDRWVNNQKD